MPTDQRMHVDYRTTLEHAADDVRTNLRISLDLLFGSVVRPRYLIERLNLDKSLASKITKAARVTSAADFIVDGPSSPGLNLFANAAEAAGLDPNHAAALRNANDNFAAALRAFPGGRAAIAASFGTNAKPTSSSRSAERRVRQSAFRSMTAIVGVELDVFYVAAIYAPSQTPGRCDTVWISSRQGLKRHRTDTLLSLGWIKKILVDNKPQQRFTIDGQPLGDDPRISLLKPFCSTHVDALQVAPTQDAHMLVAPHHVPALGDNLTITSATYQQNFAPQYATPERPYNATVASPRRPTRLFVTDHIIHNDLFTKEPPLIKSWLETPDSRSMLERAELGEIDIVEQEVTVTHAAPHEGLASPNVWRADEMVAHALQARGWDEAHFRAHSTEIEYPLMGASLAAWYKLPPAP